MSTRSELPEKADVIISDLRGVLPLYEFHLPTIIDARQRLLAPGGVVIPQQDDLYAALVSDPELYRNQVQGDVGMRYNLDWRVTARTKVHRWYSCRIKTGQIVSDIQHLATIDYRLVECPDVSGELTWQVDHEGPVHGICMWFDATLADGIQFSNAPEEAETVYGRTFFPWTQPLELMLGDVVTINITAKFVINDYVWQWDTDVCDRSGRQKAQFKQSTFYSAVTSLAQLHKREDYYVPRLSEVGQVHHWILQSMSKGMELGEIARQLVSEFPHRFATWREAFHEVAELSQEYGE